MKIFCSTFLTAVVNAQFGFPGYNGFGAYNGGYGPYGIGGSYGAGASGGSDSLGEASYWLNYANNNGCQGNVPYWAETRPWCQNTFL